MHLKSDLIVVSIFGRGFWLASQFKQLGAEVTVIDLTSAMGKSVDTDFLSPFGLFKEDNNELWNDRWSADCVLQEVKSGLAILLPDGPVELAGPIQSWKNDPERVLTIKKILHIYGSSQQIYPLHFKMHKNKELKISKLFLRHETKDSLKKSHSWLKEKGIQLIDDVSLLDVGFKDKNSVSVLEIKKERTDLLSTNHLLWCLSSEETKFLNPLIFKKIYKDKLSEPDWTWVSYKVKIERTVETAMLPAYFITVFDHDLSWSYENYLILRQLDKEQEYLVWALLPNSQRFYKNDLQQLGERIATTLSIRLKGAKVQISALPVESQLTFKDRGPSHYPVYINKIKKINKFKNMHFEHPEVWEGTHINGRFNSQRKINDKLSQWWKKKIEKELKEQKRNAK